MTRTTRARVVQVAGLAASLALVASATACASSEASPAGKNGLEISTIRYQSQPGSVDPLLLADALGDLPGITLKREGDTVSGPESIKNVASNQTDIGGAFYGAIAQLVASGAPIKAVLPYYGTDDKNFQSLVVPQDSSIRSARDLIGKKVAMNTLGGNWEAVLDTWLKNEGLSQDEIKKVTIVALPPLNTPEALAKHQIDAAFLSVKGVQIANQAVKTRTVITDRQIVGSHYDGGSLVLRDDTIKNAPHTARELVTGYAEAIEFIQTHTRDQIFAKLFPYLEKHGFGDYEEAIKANFTGSLGVAAKPVIKPEDISRWSDWLIGRGDIPADKLNVDDVYTNEFNPWVSGASATPSTGGASAGSGPAKGAASTATTGGNR
jgi:ABC-type nitrate/sulfonate/bicarbonate transport system substrate-binding protein